MAVRIVTDSTADLPPELTKALNVTVVPLNVHFGTETYRDGVDIKPDEFFARLAAAKDLPKTSQPSVGAFRDVYQQLHSQGHQIVSIHVSAKLSGTFTSATQAVPEVPGVQVELVDSMGASIWLGLVVTEAARAAQAGKPLQEVAKAARESVNNVRLYFVLDTLEYLQKGGRVGKAQAVLGSLLSIKPVLTIHDGEVHALEKVRTKVKAVERIKAIVQENAPYAEIAVLHATTLDEAKALAAEMQPYSPNKPVIATQVGPVIGVYVGPGAIGIAARKA